MFKSKTRRIMLTQNSDLDFFEIDRLAPSDLAKVGAEEKAAKKSASKQRKKSKKKAASEKPPSECPLELSQLSEGLSTEAGPEAEDSTLVSNDQLADVDLVAPDFGIGIDV